MYRTDTLALASVLVGTPWATDHNTPSRTTYPDTASIRAAILTAREWMANGFTVTEARAWMTAGAFDATAARDLRGAGLTSSDCTPMLVALHSDEIDTSIAYAYSNGDLSVAEAVALAA